MSKEETGSNSVPAKDLGADVDKNDQKPAKGLLAKCRTYFTVVNALIVRSILLIHSILCVWLVVTTREHSAFWALLLINILLVLETIYTIRKQGGLEGKWFCPCFLAYLLAVLPSIWLLELDRLEAFTSAFASSNFSTTLVAVNGLTVPLKLEPSLWLQILEQALVFLLVMCRWLLPLGGITRNELSQLLFVFLGIASDNMELFQLFDETPVRQDLVLTYVILGVWSLSFSQFTFVLTATRSPRKSKVVNVVPLEAKPKSRKEQRNLASMMFATEMWSLIFSVLVQDGSYGAVRIYVMVTKNLITYSILFFVCKNILVICLVMYRLIVICAIRCTENDDEEEDEDRSEDLDGKNRSVQIHSLRNDRKVAPAQETEEVNDESSTTL